MFIYPYNAESGSVKALRAANDDLRIIRRERSRFRGSPEKIVINWGCSQLPEEVMKCNVVNRPEAVAIAANKKSFFEAVADEVSIPEWTEDKTVAESWILNGDKVVVREKLSGHSGDGIVMLTNPVEFEEYKHDVAKIYVKYIPKKDEYRIHVFNGEVVDMQRKAIRRDMPAEQVNHQIRNHGNGFVYVREGVEPQPMVIDESIKAIKLTGLDFGAVDVIWNNHRAKAYVLEINTAPGLEGKSVETYTAATKKVNLADLLAMARAPEPVQWAVMDDPLAFPEAVAVDEDFDEPEEIFFDEEEEADF